MTSDPAIFWTIDYVFLQKRPRTAVEHRDDGSAKLWDIANTLQLAGIIVGFTSAGRIDGDGIRLQWIGLALMIAGILLRWTAVRTLGALFTGVVTIHEHHRLIRTGVYAYVRHPAYAGSLVAHLGLGLAFANWWTLAASTLPYLAAVLYRIRVEERALAGTFGDDYREHARTTRRLLPSVY